AAELAERLVRGEFPPSESDLPSETAVAFVLIQAYKEMGRLKDLRSAVEELYGATDRLPPEALWLWISLLIDIDDVAQAKDVIPFSFTTASGKMAGESTAAVIQAAHLYARHILCASERKEALHNALTWVESDDSLAALLDAEERQRLYSEIENLQAAVETRSEAQGPASTEGGGGTPIPGLDKITSQLTEAFRASAALSGEEGKPCSTATTWEASEVPWQKILMYGAFAGTFAYCVLAERRTIGRWLRRSSQNVMAPFSEMVQLALPARR
ncbi:hypothetical protein CYMTET_29772, partial [Cymbomonas tetramitiformis]